MAGSSSPAEQASELGEDLDEEILSTQVGDDALLDLAVSR